ncbi:MAG: hypothetical protein RIT28_9 [Pseudomonadota bacterium]
MSTAVSVPDAPPSAYAPPIIATLGALWSLFGVVQLLQTLQSTPQSLQAMGMTPEQAAVYSSYPAWMTLGFAVGAFGGLVGSVLLLARRRLATPIFVASLVGYVVLYVGDITEGVFAALGAPQVAVLTAVVLIASGLLVWSRHLSQRGLLR